MKGPSYLVLARPDGTMRYLSTIRIKTENGHTLAPTNTYDPTKSAGKELPNDRQFIHLQLINIRSNDVPAHANGV